KYGTTTGNYSTTIDVGDVTKTNLPNLTNGTIYYIAVSAVNVKGESDKSSEVSRMTYAATPVIQAEAMQNTIQITWGTVPGADFYKVYYGTSPGVYPVTTEVHFDRALFLSGLPDGTTYYFRVASVNEAGEGILSNEVSAVTAPGTPVVKSTESGVNKIKLYYDPVKGANYYNIYAGYEPDNYESYAGGIYGTSATMNYLDAGTQYYFGVEAVNDSGSSQVFGKISGWTLSDPPSIASITSGRDKADLTWAAVKGADSYRVYYGTKSGVYDKNYKTGNGTAYTVSGLLNGTHYYFAVAAINPGGESAKSPEQDVWTTVSYPVITAVGGARQVTVNWSAVPGADTYKVYFGTTSGVYTGSASAGIATSYTLKNLDSGTIYYFRVAAVNAGGEGVKSDQVGAVTAPPAPGIQYGAGGNQKIELHFVISKGASAYKLYYGKASGVYDQSTAIRSNDLREITGLDKGTKYYFAVSAINAAGESAKSGEASATTLADAPVIASITGGPSKVALSWGEVGADYYRVYYGTVSGVFTQNINVGKVTNYTAGGLLTGTKYYFAVSAVSNAGESAKSDVKTALTLSKPPANLTAAGGSKQVTLTWIPASGAETTVIYFGTTSGVSSGYVNAGSGTFYLFNSLQPGTAYYFQAASVNGSGEGGKADQVSATTLCAAPEIKYSVGGKNSIRVNFVPSVGAKSHRFYYGKTAGVYDHTANINSGSAYVVDGLDAGTKYYFGLGAVNNAGESPISNEISGWTLFDPPEISSALGGTAKVVLNWGDAGADYYRVYYGTTPGVYYQNINVGKVTNYSAGGLLRGKKYYFAVSAVNAGGESAKSPETSATTQ
ncbi:MAG: fibronectin type III domain-containing protein, partial [Candidatus Omnitrophica bacterium]|nr:fibronectin type III domain-containing protein [Candidatus Omnitrophota bacterium]